MEVSLTQDQITCFAIIVSALVLFVWNRWRYDVVALLALLASVVTELVPAKKAFVGFSDPVVIIVATVLVLSAAVSRSGFIDWCLKLLSGLVERKNLQVSVLVIMVMALSAFMHNVGALAVLMPIAIAFAKKTGRAPSELLMPLSFGSLMGGGLTIIGASSHLLIASVREEIVGEPYNMFDYSPVGLGICAAGVIYLSIGWRLLPKERRGATTAEEQFSIEDYISEMRVGEESPWAGRHIGEIEGMGEGEFAIVAITHDEKRTLIPSDYTRVNAGDTLLIETDPITLKELVDKYGLELEGSKEIEGKEITSDAIGVVEAVVTAESQMVRATPKRLRLRSRFGVNLLAVRHAEKLTTGSRLNWSRKLFKVDQTSKRLSDRRLQEGDVVVLQGDLSEMPQTLSELGCLPLAERNLQLGRSKVSWLPVIILGICVALTVSHVVTMEIAFMGGVLAIACLRILRLNEIYAAIDAPILVLMAAMIPVTGALQAVGGTQLIADFVAHSTGGLSQPFIIGMVLVATMLLTPFLNNVATVLLMAPVAAGLAHNLGYNVDPFLMAVAVGVCSDFLTPIGHQCNTLVMGPGGYKFSDYWRLGLPLSIIVVVTGVPLIMFFWPLQ